MFLNTEEQNGYTERAAAKINRCAYVADRPSLGEMPEMPGARGGVWVQELVAVVNPCEVRGVGAREVY